MEAMRENCNWESLMPSISFCGEIKHMGRGDWLSLQEGLCISEEVVTDALTSDRDEFDIYFCCEKEAAEEPQTDILADALKSALGDDDDLGIYLGEDRPQEDRPPTPYSQGDSPSPASSTTSGVFSCHDYESLSPWSVGSPASPQVLSMESDVPQQRFTYPSNNYGQGKVTSHNVTHYRQPVPMQRSTVDPNLACWLSQQMPSTTEPKLAAKKLTRPPEPYVALIAKAILSLRSGRALLSDIYNFAMHHYEYYRTAPVTWKNAIRHNLSVNDCFIKNGRAPHGRGYYWSVHPACLQSFLNGDFRRREAQQLANESASMQSIMGYYQYN